MTMRAPSEELPVVLDGVSVTAGPVTILDNIALTLAPGAPTVLIAIVIAVNALAWTARRAGERLAG